MLGRLTSTRDFCLVRPRQPAAITTIITNQAKMLTNAMIHFIRIVLISLGKGEWSDIYLFFAELGSLGEASQYLSQAQWAVLKDSNDISSLVKSQLHRNLGQLAAAKDNYVEARKHFAEDVCKTINWVCVFKLD